MSEIPPPEIPPSPPPPQYTPSSPFDLNEWINIWKKALTKPSAATFEELERHPLVTMQNAIIWDVIAGAVGGLLGGLIGMATTKSGFAEVITSTLVGAGVGLIGLLIFALIVYAICKAQGGTGAFETQVALLGTFVPPLLLISALLSQIPILGGVIALVLSVYQFYLYIVATQAAQNVTMGKAAIAVLLPGLLILCCVIVLVFGLIVALVPWFRTTGALPLIGF